MATLQIVRMSSAGGQPAFYLHLPFSLSLPPSLPFSQSPVAVLSSPCPFASTPKWERNTLMIGWQIVHPTMQVTAAWCTWWEATAPTRRRLHQKLQVWQMYTYKATLWKAVTNDGLDKSESLERDICILLTAFKCSYEGYAIQVFLGISCVDSIIHKHEWHLSLWIPSS